MQDEALAPGDVVQLRSGSAPMCVESCEPGASAKCVWFCEANSCFNTLTVSQSCLRKVDPLPEIDPGV